VLTSLKHALRVLRKDPGFTAVAICSMAVGIGATSSMFSFADAMLLRPLHVAQPDRVIAVGTQTPAAFGIAPKISYRDYVDLRDHSRAFAGLAATVYTSFGFSPDSRTQPHMKFGYFVSGNFFDVLGIRPALGRVFRPDEDKVEGRDAVVVLGHDFWVSQYRANGSVLGSTVRLNGIPFTVIGVAPESFPGVDLVMRPTMFVPLAMAPRMGMKDFLHNRDASGLVVKGRLRPGVSVAQANADVAALAPGLLKLHKQEERDRLLKAETELQLRVEQGPIVVAMSVMLCALGIAVLLVACANVAGLLLSRARARSREFAVRLAIGAGRGALVRQLLLENLLVAIAGGCGAVAVADLVGAYIRRMPIPTDVPIVFDMGVDHRVFLFTLAISVLSTLFFGLAPALRASSPELVPALKASSADSAGKPRLWGRNLIVSGQVAVSLVLLAVAAAMVQGFRRELTGGSGFRVDHLFLTSFDAKLAHYSDEQSSLFYENLLRRSRSAPGLRSAALASNLPMNGFDQIGIVVEGFPLPRGVQASPGFAICASDGYFRTMDIPILNGRGFLESDRENTPRVAVVNEHMARHFWPKGDALGKVFHLETATGEAVRIVGIARQSKYNWVAELPMDFFYLPFRQHPRSGMTMIAQSDAPDAAAIAPVVRDVVRGIDPDMPVFDVRTMRDYYQQRAVGTSGILTQMVAGLGLMGLLLAVVGLYGLVAYSVSRRTREIAIRMAIGADRREVMRMVLGQGMRLGVAGIVVGMVLSVFACRLATAVAPLATLERIDPVLFLGVPLLFLMVTTLATWFPARRASKIDPMRALQDE